MGAHLLDSIETPEGIRLERRLAGIGSRLLAGLIDGVLITAVWTAVGVLAVRTAGNPMSWWPGAEGALSWALAVVIGVGFVVYWGYFALCEWFMNGQSPGKRAQQLRVVKEGGGPISLVDIAIRNLLRIVDGIAFYAVGGVAMFVSPKGQRLGDLAAGTVVASERSPDYAAVAHRPPVEDGWGAAWPAGLHAAGMTPEEFRLLRNYCLRRHELTWEARCRLLPRLVAPVLQRTGRSLPNHAIATFEHFVDELMQRAYAGEPLAPPAGE